MIARPLPSSKRLDARSALGIAVLVLAPLLACSAPQAAPNPGLSGPVSVRAAISSREGTGGYVVFVSNANRNELRVFVPETGLFVRGPNAISPLSIPVGFRPERLAAGAVDGPEGPRGFVLVAGPAPRVELVGAQTFRVNRSPDELAACDAGGPGVYCLGGDSRDVATAAGGRAFVAVGGTASAPPSVALLQAEVNEGLAQIRFVGRHSISGEPSSIAAVADGSRVFVGDGAAARVLEVETATGSTRELRAARPVHRVASVPAYVGENGRLHEDGEIVLAILDDGSIQALSPDLGGPASDPLGGGDIAPLRFAAPALDLAFVPCNGAPSGAPCLTQLRVASGETRLLPLLAFAALADGTSVPLGPDASEPQVFRAFDRNAEGPAVGAVSFRGTAAGDAPTLQVEAGSATEGVTRSESIRVVHRGVLPGVRQRPATLSLDAGVLTLADPAGGLATRARATSGDSARLSALPGTACPALVSGVSLVVSAVAETRLTFLPPDPPLDAGCFPAQVTYDLRAGGAEPWVVTGSASGFLGRAARDTRFAAEPPRFAYPMGAAAGPAFAFVISGNDPEGEDAEFTFNTTSGFSPLLVAPDPDELSLAAGVTAVPGRLYLTFIGGDALVEARLAELSQAGSVRIFREVRVTASSGLGGFGGF